MVMDIRPDISRPLLFPEADALDPTPAEIQTDFILRLLAFAKKPGNRSCPPSMNNMTTPFIRVSLGVARLAPAFQVGGTFRSADAARSRTRI
jgi:hypothetical protein